MRDRFRLWHVAAVLVLLVAGVLPALMPFWSLVEAPLEAVASLGDLLLWKRFATTLGIIFATLSLALPLGLIQGWLLARSDVPGRGWFLIAAPLPLFLPPLAHVLSWFGTVGLKGYPAIVLVYVIAFMPFIVLLTVKALGQTSQAQVDALMLDGGAGAVVRDDVRQALPAAGMGGLLASVFIVSDFAVADFLSSIGPKVTVYADSLYAHHVAWRDAAMSAVSLPGFLLCGFALFWIVRYRRRLGASVDPDFTPARPMSLGYARGSLWLVMLVLTVLGTVFPIVALVAQTGSMEVLLEQVRAGRDRIGFTFALGISVATGLIVLSLLLVTLAGRLRRPWAMDALVFLPFAVPALLFGVGLIRLWNRPVLEMVYDGAGLLWLGLVGRYIAFAYLPVAGVLERLDRTLMEAAQVAGAGQWDCFRHVVFPLVRGPIMLVWCWTFCFALRELDGLIMLQAGQRSLMHHLYANVIFSRPDEVAGIALLLIGVIAGPLLMYLGFARRFLENR
jgi:iron(III) transport system permease protein